MPRKKSGNQLSGWFKNQLAKQRWLILVFGNDGLEARRIIYCPNRSLFRDKGVIRFLRVNESNLHTDKIFRLFSKVCFFPFRYKIMVVSPRKLCRSKYFTVEVDRKNHTAPIDANELASIFSQNLWPTLEANKKEFIKANGYEDLDVILVHSQVVDVSIDGNNLANLDDVFSVKGRVFSSGVVQTLLYRGFFSSLKKTFPKRASFREFHEYGFNLPLSVLVRSKDSAEKKIKKFIVASVGETETDIALFDGKNLYHYDTFLFGRRSLYDALHHVMNIDITVFNGLLKKIVSDDMSSAIKKKLVSFLDKELARLGNGISAFKKETKAQGFYVDGQALNPFLSLHSRYAPWIFDNSTCNCRCKTGVSGLLFNDKLKADLLCAIGLEKSDQVNAIATRQIRWMIPHNVEVK